MILPLLLLALQAGPPATVADRATGCIALARRNPAAGVAEATRWRSAGGGAAAAACLGLAEVARERWAPAATAFEDAARAAAAARDPQVAALAAGYWAQGGNAWLAATDADRARTALDAALALGTLTGLQLGEAHLDRARALVALGSSAAAREDLDAGLLTAADDPLAWLLSATLARRTADLPRARRDIAEALRRAADDPSVQLEAGNIAASAGDEAGAQGAWREAVRLAPQTPAGRSAAVALQQFD